MMRCAAQTPEAADFAAGHLVGPTSSLARADRKPRRIEDDVGDDITQRAQLSRELDPVRTNPADVAIVAHVHQRDMRIEDLHLLDTGRDGSDRGLRTWIVERAERIGRGINRGSRNPWAIQ